MRQRLLSLQFSAFTGEHNSVILAYTFILSRFSQYLRTIHEVDYWVPPFATKLQMKPILALIISLVRGQFERAREPSLKYTIRVVLLGDSLQCLALRFSI